MHSQLELVSLVRAGVKFAGGGSKSERHFLDFVVDGQSLWHTLGKRHDTVSVLCAEFIPDETSKSVGHLLLKERTYPSNGRCSLFVCAECGDLGCGAITVLVERTAGTFIWKAFGYENTYEQIRLDDYDSFGPYTFDAANYERILTHGLSLLNGAGRNEEL
jgi:hypothetical protein